MNAAEPDPGLVLQSAQRIVVFVTRHKTMSSYGGCHRFHQVLCDLQQATSCAVLVVRPHDLALVPGIDSFRPPRWRRLRRKISRVVRSLYDRIRCYVEPGSTNITVLRTRENYNQAFLDRFDYLLSQRLAKRAVVVAVDDVALFPYLGVATANGLPTLIFAENYECLAHRRTAVQTSRDFAPALRDLSGELALLAQADARLMISRVEAGFLTGLGVLRTWYYPYRPAGMVSERFLQIRTMRQSCARTTGLCIALGSATHWPTRDSFVWLVHQVQQHGLPPGWNLVLMGSGTEAVLASFPGLPNVKALGTVSNEVLATYLSTAEVALIPCVRGFGALTRLPELSAAGLPVLASAEVSLAQTLAPGVWTLPNDWSAWKAALAARQWVEPALEAYQAWHEAQPCPLREALAAVTGDCQEPARPGSVCYG